MGSDGHQTSTTPFQIILDKRSYLDYQNENYRPVQSPTVSHFVPLAQAAEYGQGFLRRDDRQCFHACIWRLLAHVSGLLEVRYVISDFACAVRNCKYQSDSFPEVTGTSPQALRYTREWR